MAISLNDLKSKKPKKAKLNLNLDALPQETEDRDEPEARQNLKQLSEQLKNDLDKFDDKNLSPIEPLKGKAEMSPGDMKRPWESFNIEEMTTHMRSERAVKKARLIVDRNNKLIEELRSRARLLNEDPESFFNQ